MCWALGLAPSDILWKYLQIRSCSVAQWALKGNPSRCRPSSRKLCDFCVIWPPRWLSSVSSSAKQKERKYLFSIVVAERSELIHMDTQLTAVAQMRNMRLGEAQSLARARSPRKWPSWDVNPVCLQSLSLNLTLSLSDNVCINIQFYIKQL